MTIKQVVCLANSKKLGGRCIAGREIPDGAVGAWIRPVGNRPEGELYPHEIRLQGGASPRILDILEIGLSKPLPESCQRENYLVDPGFHWRRIGRFEAARITSLCEVPATLWVNGSHSYNGMNDRIEEARCDCLPSSLVLVQPSSPQIVVQKELKKTKVRMEFRLGEAQYGLVVTDTLYSEEYLSRGEGTYRYDGRCAICVSIGDVYKGYRYKLVASVIEF